MSTCPIAGQKTDGHYYCTREVGHDGPCAAVPTREARMEVFLAALIRKYGKPIGVEGEEAYSLTLPFSEGEGLTDVRVYPADLSDGLGKTFIALLKSE